MINFVAECLSIMGNIRVATSFGYEKDNYKSLSRSCGNLKYTFDQPLSAVPTVSNEVAYFNMLGVYVEYE